jgi:hypothetical protein
MKKLFFTLALAFSLNSFANEVENKNVVRPIKKVATSELTNTTKDDYCYDVTIQWIEVTGEPGADSIDDGIIITQHKISFTICL